MGVFQVKLTISHFTDAAQRQEVEVWVDTGSAYSWISRGRLEALGARPIRRMQFRTIEGRLVERELAPVMVSIDGYSGADNIVMAEPGDMEVIGSFTLEGLGLAVDPVQKKLVPTVGLALSSVREARHLHRSRVVESVADAIRSGFLYEPFSNRAFRSACPGFGPGTYNTF